MRVFEISSRVWNGNKRTLWLWPGLPTACKETSLVQTVMEWYMVIFCFVVKGVFEHIGRPFNSIWSKQKESLLSWLKLAFWVLGQSKSAQMPMYELEFDIFSSRRIPCKQLMYLIVQKNVVENIDRGSCTEYTQRLCSGKGRKLITVIKPLWKAF